MNDVGAKIPALWRSVGIELRISPDRLDGIEEQYSRNPIRCFEAVFRTWEDATTPPYTWDTIVNVLESPLVDKRDLANDLRRKYNLVGGSTPSLTTTPLPDYSTGGSTDYNRTLQIPGMKCLLKLH